MIEVEFRKEMKLKKEKKSHLGGVKVNNAVLRLYSQETEGGLMKDELGYLLAGIIDSDGHIGKRPMLEIALC